MQYVLGGSGAVVEATDSIESIVEGVESESMRKYLGDDTDKLTDVVDVVIEKINDAYNIVAFPYPVEKSAEDSTDTSADDPIYKSTGEQYGTVLKRKADQYTLQPWYIPNTVDAHNDFMTPDDLQKALWAHIRKDDRRIRYQHDPSVVIGERVEAVSWPQEVEMELTLPTVTQKDAKSKKYTFPAGTVFMGVQWNDEGWDKVEKGEITGLSMGGRSGRIYVDLD